ncbi:TMV resistance protein N isoform X1 [Cinnamomum micranthum f. kanehirae]|uniref:TMV resistance protein N isoform X1 n=1 Tax=Cinnamomum micranthum f. kanehirae TaxID=337451 RepID=A0A3S3QYH3_9MAGN|nr:TMV resistance protein N isoform X1 [Cinnamomum micranthum f. kanehirae]
MPSSKNLFKEVRENGGEQRCVAANAGVQAPVGRVPELQRGKTLATASRTFFTRSWTGKGSECPRHNDVLKPGGRDRFGLCSKGSKTPPPRLRSSLPTTPPPGGASRSLRRSVTLGRLILPVFYFVDPSDVRAKEGLSKEAFGILRARFKEHEVRRWRNAMAKTGGRVGWVLPK